MKRSLIIAFICLLTLSISLPACNKHTCPTYATSQPTKGVKKAVKKSRAAYDKGNTKKDKKTAKGKATSGI